MRRLQIGGMGLLTVLLIVSLASLVSSRGNRDAVGDGLASVTATNEVVSEPLVELGAQPTIQPEAAPPPDARNTVGGEDVANPPVVPDLEPDPTLERARRAGR